MTRSAAILRASFPVAALLLWAATAAAQYGPIPPRKPAGRYLKTVTVSPAATPQESGQRLLAALQAIEGTAEDRWLVQIQPGIYDLGTARLRMRPWVDVEGSGILSTEILGVGLDPDGYFTDGIVQGADDSELRHLTVHCRDSAELPGCRAISNLGASPRLAHLRLLAETRFGSATGVRNSLASAPILEDLEIFATSAAGDSYGIVNAGTSRPSIRRVDVTAADGPISNAAMVNKEGGLPAVLEGATLTASGGGRNYGIWGLEASATDPLRLSQVTITVVDGEESYGIEGGVYPVEVHQSRIYAYGPESVGIDMPTGDVRLANSEVQGEEAAILAATVKVGGSWLGGGGVVASVKAQCAGVVDESFAFFASSCP